MVARALDQAQCMWCCTRTTCFAAGLRITGMGRARGFVPSRNSLDLDFRWIFKRFRSLPLSPALSVWPRIFRLMDFTDALRAAAFPPPRMVFGCPLPHCQCCDLSDSPSPAPCAPGRKLLNRCSLCRVNLRMSAECNSCTFLRHRLILNTRAVCSLSQTSRTAGLPPQAQTVQAPTSTSEPTCPRMQCCTLCCCWATALQ